ncbi:MAG: phosphoribosylaminoimidazolesuccinocarboxamide synthase [Anaerolineae bacterium]
MRLDPNAVIAAIPWALQEVDIPELGPVLRGKVRDCYVIGDKRILITTDRLSAFDRVLGLVPYKGQVLNQLSRFWFEAVSDIVPSHMISTPDPNVMLAHEGQAFPVEIVVRGYITGVTTTSLWYNYERGERRMYGLTLPDGLRKNQALPQPVITPTTRATGPGGHDERITPAEIVERGLMTQADWDAVTAKALAIFARGQEVCARGGLILVDTKYEFGRVNGEIALIDEMHTPDSSRFWRADTYEARFAAGQEPDNFDKEFVRLWYSEQGYRGDGEPPAMDEALVVQATLRYATVYEMITGRQFEPAPYPAGPRIRSALRQASFLS